MKRLGHVYEMLYDRDTLLTAWGRVRHGHCGYSRVREFSRDYENGLRQIGRQLEEGDYSFGPYRFFTIHRPKDREIATATVQDRIVHHAIILTCGERLERALVDSSYACRRGKGQWEAVAQAQRMAKRHPWSLKMDVRHYFATIDHELLLRALAHKIKDARMLALFEKLISSYDSEEGKGLGLPIGNLTSQYFANLYLDPVDRLVTASGKFGYVRYMDDILVFGGREELKALTRQITETLATLGLAPKTLGTIQPSWRGVDFLGMRVFPWTLRFTRRNRVEFPRKVRRIEHAYEAGEIGERTLQRRLSSIFGFASHAETKGLRRKALGVGEQDAGLPRRHLVQQQRLSAVVPLGLSQLQREQQHETVQQQQLLGLSCCLHPSSPKPNQETVMDRSSSCSRSSDETKTHAGDGVGRSSAEGYARSFSSKIHTFFVQAKEGLQL